MNLSCKLYANQMFVFILIFTSSIFSSCSTMKNSEPEPGQSLGIASIPNLRDMGGYETANGATVARGLAYRSNQLNNISESDMLLLADLRLKNAFDLRTAAERNENRDELPVGVNNVWLDVLADVPGSGPANLTALLSDPKKANIELGDGKVEKMFREAYRHSVSLPSAKKAYRKLFLSLGDENRVPALFHCTGGKDRTGWAAAALLTFLGVPMEAVKQDYLYSNDYVLPMYDTFIQQFMKEGGNSSIPLAIFGVKEEYLNAAFDEMHTKYGTIENYFTEGLGITVDQQAALRDLFLTN